MVTLVSVITHLPSFLKAFPPVIVLVSDVNHTYWIDDRVKYLLSVAFSAEVPPMLTCHKRFVSRFDGSCPMTISLKSLGVHKYASVSFSPSLI